jgi:hypothetical protein
MVRGYLYESLALRPRTAILSGIAPGASMRASSWVASTQTAASPDTISGTWSPRPDRHRRVSVAATPTRTRGIAVPSHRRQQTVSLSPVAHRRIAQHERVRPVTVWCACSTLPCSGASRWAKARLHSMRGAIKAASGRPQLVGCNHPANRHHAAQRFAVNHPCPRTGRSVKTRPSNNDRPCRTGTQTLRSSPGFAAGPSAIAAPSLHEVTQCATSQNRTPVHLRVGQSDAAHYRMVSAKMIRWRLGFDFIHSKVIRFVTAQRS